MKSELTYSEAYSKLQDLVEQLEEGNIPLDKLAASVKQARELVAVCEKKLRLIETETGEAAGEDSGKGRKRKKG